MLCPLMHLQSNAVVCVACSDFISLGFCCRVTQRVVYFLSSHTTRHPHDLHTLSAPGRTVRQADGPCVCLQPQRSGRVARLSQRWFEPHRSDGQHWFPKVGVQRALIQSMTKRNDVRVIRIVLHSRTAVPVTSFCQITFNELVRPTTLINR